MLDRRITVRVEVAGTNQFGEPESTTTDYPVWASLIQDKVSRGIGVGGVYANADRVWRVRFNAAFLGALGEGREVVVLSGPQGGSTPNPNRDTITGLGEPDRTGRRRFLDLLS